MIKILNDNLRLSEAIADTTNGIGILQPLTCYVTEELNGMYEAELTLLPDNIHFNDLHVGGILSIPVDELETMQAFRIYYISKPLKEVTVKAQHITYDLNKMPVKNFRATGAVGTKNELLRNVMVSSDFTMTTNITNTTSVYRNDIPRSFRECLGGYEGSILDVFRCEYEWDNLTVKMLSKRGTDNGVRISYGKNLTDFVQEENIENVYNAVLGLSLIHI